MTLAPASPSGSPAPAAAVRRRLPRRLLPLGGGRLFLAALVTLALLAVAAIFAPLLAPADPLQTDLSQSLVGPSSEHLLGADQSGRDTLSRLIYGARLGLLGPVYVVTFSTLLGLVFGLVAAWNGGWVDTLLSRSQELVFAFPGLLLALLSVAAFGSGLLAPSIAMAIAYFPYVGRLVRSAAIAELAKPYVAAYGVQGFSGWTISVRHVLPNIGGIVLAQSALNFGYALMDLAALSYLGFGVQPPAPDWGAMISDGQTALLEGYPLPVIAPGVVIVLAVIAFTLVGEGIADRVARQERA
ncbi:MAG: Dipeptide transport system permease protein DppC [uncultured Nocardioidaceae bacterium]|uniref:Dipeptide transport system permease protein DppC n=1 Tax=uncultured Nocardioidaceae bacterium TaxID=253824 RepID=A0A6J4N7T0_9ACTN|nr:MAG: Dipeptide transport system permease protein DppC [uncultured Nocardioidaceae bacterium]